MSWKDDIWRPDSSEIPGGRERDASVDESPRARDDLTSPEENRRRRKLVLNRIRGEPFGFELQTYGIHHSGWQELELCTYVSRVHDDSPAFYCGLTPGDVILSVNDVDVAHADHQVIVQYIREAGDKLVLIVLFENCIKKVELEVKLLKTKRLLFNRELELRALVMKEKQILKGVTLTTGARNRECSGDVTSLGYKPVLGSSVRPFSSQQLLQMFLVKVPEGTASLLSWLKYPLLRTRVDKNKNSLPICEPGLSKFGRWITAHPWDEVYTATTTTDKANAFYTTLTAAIDKFFPAKTVKLHPEDKPWICPKPLTEFDHATAIKCLLDLGVRPALAPWVYNFMSNRRQRVNYMGETSDWTHLTCGVAQGTILGPIIFMAMIDGALRDVCDRWKYVDDMNLAQTWSIHQPCSLQLTLDNLNIWIGQHKMKLNPGKCKALHVCYAKSPPQPEPLTIDGQELETVGSVKVVGVTVQSDLKWNLHVSQMISGANRKLYLLRRLKCFGNCSTTGPVHMETQQGTETDCNNPREVRRETAGTVAPLLPIQFIRRGQKPRGVAPTRGSSNIGGGPLCRGVWEMLVDLDKQLHFPSVICETALRPDLVLWSVDQKSVVIVELTVPWEENLQTAYERNKLKYEELVQECRENGWRTQLYPVEVGVRGFVGASLLRLYRDLKIRGKAQTQLVRLVSEEVEKSRFG
ncbi:GRASP [Branchiostoma lanceolatum]|uniref:GRASP protein n=1 Tax=Branchiostoma lanceolatum TaxID=7740 RepID=A0A8J9Z8S3_BRALA|nr:GRASP [Branchiostoma lanceolatum]